MSNEFYLTAPCVGKRSCGARVGEKCIDKRGNILAPSQSHKARKDEYELRSQLQATEEQLRGSSKDQLRSEVRGSIERFDLRANRINTVLGGIRIARHLGMMQDALDLRLAEMIVDADGDQK